VNPCHEELRGNVGHALGLRFERASRRAGVEWKRNGFRHSYISYRVAAIKDVPAVALECGNSPQVIFSSYRALATDAEPRLGSLFFRRSGMRTSFRCKSPLIDGAEHTGAVTLLSAR
jgi:hypothetical protein